MAGRCCHALTLLATGERSLWLLLLLRWILHYFSLIPKFGASNAHGGYTLWLQLPSLSSISSIAGAQVEGIIHRELKSHPTSTYPCVNGGPGDTF